MTFFVVLLFLVKYTYKTNLGIKVSKKKNKRRDDITTIVLEHGAVSVGDLAENLGVSMQTIRRDIDKLCESDKLVRRHGRIELGAEYLQMQQVMTIMGQLINLIDLAYQSVEMKL